jgi:hypothetical protein
VTDISLHKEDDCNIHNYPVITKIKGDKSENET